MKRKMLVVLVAASVLAVVGCITMPIRWFQEGVYGPGFRLFEVNPIVGNLDEYQRVEIEPFANDIPHLAPEPTLTRIAPEIASLLREQELFPDVTAVPEATKAPTTVPTLLIKGDVVDYDPGDSNERVFCLGGEAYLTARVTLIDKRSGKIVGTANAGGVVRTTFNVPNDTALGVAKAVAQWLKENHSPVEKKG